MAKPELTPADCRQLIGRDDALIVEVGANDGEDTERFLAAFPAGRIVCFEPDARAIAKWRGRIKCDRASLCPAALDSASGFREFYQSGGWPRNWRGQAEGDWDKSGSLLAPDRHTEYSPWLRFKPPVTVCTLSLDTAMAMHALQDRSVDLLWIDVQGAEDRVLRGGPATLSRTQYVYHECHPRPFYHGQATLDELASLLEDFDLIGEYAGDNYLWRRRP